MATYKVLCSRRGNLLETPFQLFTKATIECFGG